MEKKEEKTVNFQFNNKSLWALGEIEWKKCILSDNGLCHGIRIQRPTVGWISKIDILTVKRFYFSYIDTMRRCIIATESNAESQKR